MEKNRTTILLRKSEEKYRKQFEESMDAIIIADAETGIIVDCNRAATKLVGRTKSELIGEHQKILHAPESFEGDFTTTFKEHRNDMKNQVVEDKILTKTGLVRDVLIKASEFEVNNRRLIQGIFRDVTERNKTREKIEQERKTLELVTRHTGTGLSIISKDYHIIWANKYLEQLRGELKGKQCYLKLSEYTDVCPNCGVKEVFDTGKDKVIHEQFVIAKDGTKHWLEISASPIRDTHNNIVAVAEMSIDITERKKAEIMLKESEEKFRAISDSAMDGIILGSYTGKIIYLNHAAEQIFGYSFQDAKDKRIIDLLVSNDLKKEATSILESFVKMNPDKQSVHIQEFSAVRRDGKKITLEITLRKLTLNNEPHILGTLSDITEQNAAWESLEETMNTLMVVNEKLSVVGKLTRHDARNKLAVILNYLYLAKKKIKNCNEVAQYCSNVETAVEQMRKIFDFTASYEMLGVEELTPINVGQKLQEAVMIQDLGNVKLENQTHNLPVMADSMLRQLLYNLLDDSLKHGKHVTTINVHYVLEEDHLQLIYEDNGVGISLEEKALIFKEGYGKGTGYGLYLITKICEAYGWQIQENGEPDKGVHFVMTIPKVNKKGKPNYQIQ